MGYNKTTAAVALTFLMAGQPAFAADLVTAKQPSQILSIAKGFGSAKLETDNSGDPVIRGRIDGTRYTVYFYGCDSGKNCDDIQFMAGWSGYKVSRAALNNWNKERRYGTAYLDDENDPILHMAVNLKYGVSRQNLDDTFDWWKVALKDFTKEVLGD